MQSDSGYPMAQQTTESSASQALKGLSLVMALTAVVAGELRAEEPYLALRTGLKCSQCHVNRTGGGGRNDFGNAWSQTELPFRTLNAKGRGLNDWVSLGFDLRVFAAAAVSETTPRTEAGVSEAQLYLQAKLIPNVVSFYVDQTLGPGGASTREVFGLFESLPLDGYIKAGKFVLPFGWRLWDDAAFIRSQTGFTFKTPDQGIELGAEPGPLSIMVSLTNGNTAPVENDDQKQLTSSAAFVHRHFRLGASASHNSNSASKRNVFGGWGGVGFGSLAVLGEVDYVAESASDASAGDLADQLVAYVEGNYLFLKGLNAKLAYGYHDPNLDVDEDQRIRVRVGLEAFPVSFVQLSAFYTFLEDVPQVETDVDVISVELHLYF